MTAFQAITDQAEIDSYLEKLAQEQSPVAIGTFSQLEDLEVVRIVSFAEDIHCTKAHDPLSDAWLVSQGVPSIDSEKTLWIVDGNVVLDESVSVPLYIIVRGDVTLPSLRVYCGEDFFVCFGTCNARYIESDYNGVISCIRRAAADFLFLSTDGCLAVLEVASGTIVLEHYDREILEDMFADGLFVDGIVSEQCKSLIAKGENVFRMDIRGVIREIDRISVDTLNVCRALASIDGIESFRFWDHKRAMGTALHALATVEGNEDEIASAIQALYAAGVPLEQEGKKMRYKLGVGTALHVAICHGNPTTAQAFVKAGADINTGGGRLMKIILEPLESMATYPDRFSAEQKKELVLVSKTSLQLAERLGYRPIGELKALAIRHIKSIEHPSKKSTRRRR